MKPRIFICMHYMEIGGAEISLIGLLHAIDYERYDVDLFIYSHRGELMSQIPSQVNLLPEVKIYSMIEQPMSTALKVGFVGLVARRLKARREWRKYRKSHPAQGDDAAIMQYVGDWVTPGLPPINPEVEYDLAISFLTPHNICRDKVRARRIIAWIHTDYSTVDINAQMELPVWSAFDTIASISPEVTRSFLKTFPSLAPKIVEIENILSPAFVRSRAEVFDASGEFSDTFNLLSVGRFCRAKNYDNLPDICRRIVERGIDIRWYIIGYGGEETLVRKKIVEAGMERHVVLLGKKENPYPYIKACDLYVQPSRYEGKSVTVREAQMLCKPVAVTAYPTARSQVSNGVDGVIVPLDNEGCARGLADVIRNHKLQQSLVEYLHMHDYGNESEVEKIYELLR